MKRNDPNHKVYEIGMTSKVVFPKSPNLFKNGQLLSETCYIDSDTGHV